LNLVIRDYRSSISHSFPFFYIARQLSKSLTQQIEERNEQETRKRKAIQVEIPLTFLKITDSNPHFLKY